MKDDAEPAKDARRTQRQATVAIVLTCVLFATSAYATPDDDAAVLSAVAAKVCTEVEKYAILSSVAAGAGWLFHPKDEPPDPHADELAALVLRNPAGTALLTDVDYACLRLTDGKLLHEIFAAEKHNGWQLFREKFAPAKSLVRLSLPTYQGDEARLIVAVQRDWLNGDGFLWVLERDGSTWRFVSSDRLWIS